MNLNHLLHITCFKTETAIKSHILKIREGIIHINLVFKMNAKEAAMKFSNVIKHNVIEVKLDTRFKKI